MNDTVLKVIEVSMDFLEFLISSLPEAIFNHIEQIIKILLRHIQNKKETIAQKANDILLLSIEILTSNVLLPHLVGILEEISHENT